MARDVGGYFDKLTQRGRGGRRLESAWDDDELLDAERPVESEAPGRPRATSGGGLKDILTDILGRGREQASQTTRRTAEKVRRTTRRATERTKRRGERQAGRRTLPPEGVVTIAYSPRMDGDPDPGEVVWTWVPFEEDPDQGKDRPVVVIGRRGRHLVGVPLTTKRSDREAQIAIGTGDWDPKRRPSYARIWRMLDLDGDRMRREGAVLERRRFDRVTEAVDEYYEVRRPAGRGHDFDHDPDHDD